jgi:hypothetical protein
VPLSGVGDYPIVPTLHDPDGKLVNYVVNPINGTLSVEAAAATVTAKHKSKAYGNDIPSLEAEVTGQVIGGDPIHYSLATTATPLSGVGSYPITVTLGSNPNYTVTTIDSTLTVDPAALSITANSQSKTYGQALSFHGSEFIASGLVNGDSVTSVTLTSTGAAASALVGPHPIIPSAASGPGLDNYSITYNDGTLTVSPASLSITAKDQTKNYGQAWLFGGTDFTAIGLANDDAITGVTLTSDAASPSAAVGEYSITSSAAVGTGLDNYAISYQAGKFTVTPAALSIIANDRSKTFGETVTFDGSEFSASGLVNGDSVASLSLSSMGTGASALVGTYPVIASSASGARLNNYTISYTDGTLTVSPANLEVTIEAPSSGFVAPVNTDIAFQGSFTETGVQGPYQAVWTFESATVTAHDEPAGISGTGIINAFRIPTPGVYSVELTVTDPTQPRGVSTTADTVGGADGLPAYVVIYDPAAGFVKGGGWINSPLGAINPDLPNADAVGKATFGFVSRYEKGANKPTGNTEFQFKAGELHFKSSNYEWLVVSGARSQFKGTGSINGQEGYGFLLTAVDGQVTGGGGADRFRIKIWDKVADDAVVYDNQRGTDDNTALADQTIIGGGSIVIHQPPQGKK